MGKEMETIMGGLNGVLTGWPCSVYRPFEAWRPATQKSDAASVDSTDGVWTRMQDKCTNVVAGIYHKFGWFSTHFSCIPSIKKESRLMEITVQIEKDLLEDLFLRELVRASGCRSPEKWVESVVREKMAAHPDYRSCGSCKRDVYPVPQSKVRIVNGRMRVEHGWCSGEFCPFCGEKIEKLPVTSE